MKVQANSLELRGVANKVSKNGTLFYILNVEAEDGTPHALYCPKMESLPQGLKKGDLVNVVFDYVTFGRTERLVVSQVEKVTA